MQPVLQSILGSPLTPAAALVTIVVLNVTAFFRGWVVSSKQVALVTSVQNQRITEANKRADDWQAAYYASEAKNGILAEQLKTLTIVGETVDKILSALPAPSGARIGGSSA